MHVYMYVGELIANVSTKVINRKVVVVAAVVVVVCMYVYMYVSELIAQVIVMMCE